MTAADMQQTISTLPARWQLNAVTLVVGVKLLGEFISVVRNGGGLRRILFSFWYGENLPQVVAKDYAKELSAPPWPMKPANPPAPDPKP